MTKKQIHKLAELSYSEQQLDIEKVDVVVKKLSHEDLREYIKEIKYIEQERSVVVTIPYSADDTTKNTFSVLFPDKKIVYNIDPKILPGIRIQMNDLLYEMSLTERIEKLVSHIHEHYE